MTKTQTSIRPSIDQVPAVSGFASLMPVADRDAASRVEAIVPIIRKLAESHASRFNHTLPSASADTLA